MFWIQKADILYNKGNTGLSVFHIGGSTPTSQKFAHSPPLLPGKIPQ